MTPSPTPQTNNVHQIFQGAVEHVAGRDVVITNELGGRALTQNERIELNKLVGQLADEFGQEGWKTWQFLHQTIGVNKIGEMRLEHLKPAQVLLQLMLEAKQAESTNIESDHWYPELLSSQQELREQSRILTQLRSTVAQWEIIGEALRQERDQLKLALDGQCNLANQQRRETQTLAVEVKRLQQRCAHEGQEHRYAQAEVVRSARRQDDLERQIDNLISGRLVDAEALALAQKKAEQAQRVVRRLRGSLICGGVLAALATGAAVYKPLFQAELRAEQSKAVMLKRKDICLFDGEPFSWGTRLKTTTGMQKCVKSRTGQYLWQPDR